MVQNTLVCFFCEVGRTNVLTFLPGDFNVCIPKQTNKQPLKKYTRNCQVEMPPVIRDHVGLWDSDQPDRWSPVGKTKQY